ncbi:DUF202 domain-containing protein [Gillisia sp. Q332]|uniref:DUF202 domain-containing protein n=1 Tax=Gillisia xinjiangensis TaxID=3384765 RepID=UPI00391C3787
MMRRVNIRNPFGSQRIIDESLIREHLALERTRLANERTLLSYTQASLYFLLGGLALLQLKKYEDLKYIGYLALIFSGLFLTIGIWRYISLNRKMKKLLRPDKSRDKKEKKEPTGENQR